MREIHLESHIITSAILDRDVLIDCYFPSYVDPDEVNILLINDGQDLPTMGLKNILEELYNSEGISPLLCVGIHCSKDRRNEYATAKVLDYKGRGSKAVNYQSFLLKELLPYVRKKFQVPSYREKSICGFSLGGLSAIDTAWNHPEEFCKIGVFSGSLWWRTVSQDDPIFNEDLHRIMHQQVRNGSYYPWLKFFFETGTLDEIADRNQNGVIDAIDDTLSLIDELLKKGYDRKSDIKYVELSDGRHDVQTWGRAFPEFFKWGWGTK